MSIATLMAADRVRRAQEAESADSDLAQRLRQQADNVEADGWINAARYMRQAADRITGCVRS